MKANKKLNEELKKQDNKAVELNDDELNGVAGGQAVTLTAALGSLSQVSLNAEKVDAAATGVKSMGIASASAAFGVNLTEAVAPTLKVTEFQPE